GFFLVDAGGDGFNGGGEPSLDYGYGLERVAEEVTEEIGEPFVKAAADRAIEDERDPTGEICHRMVKSDDPESRFDGARFPPATN
ncbi:hypothetical protein ACP3W1_25840, partial [Salmonella enterica]|uniref:hypothetical protein n=1 Tax=Salmonella enterica TaxID=28901 RepID=UPI003CF4F01B